MYNGYPPGSSSPYGRRVNGPGRGASWAGPGVRGRRSPAHIDARLNVRRPRPAPAAAAETGRRRWLAGTVRVHYGTMVWPWSGGAAAPARRRDHVAPPTAMRLPLAPLTPAHPALPHSLTTEDNAQLVTSLCWNPGGGRCLLRLSREIAGPDRRGRATSGCGRDPDRAGRSLSACSTGRWVRDTSGPACGARSGAGSAVRRRR